MACIRERGRAEDFRDLVIEFGEDVEQGEEGLVVIKWERLLFARIQPRSASEMARKRPTTWGRDIYASEGSVYVRA